MKYVPNGAQAIKSKNVLEITNQNGKGHAQIIAKVLHYAIISGGTNTAC